MSAAKGGWVFVGALVGACATAARTPAAPVSCAPSPVDDRGRVAWSETTLDGTNGEVAFTYDDRNRVATRTIEVDDPLALTACQGHVGFGPPACAFTSSGYTLVEYVDRYAYDDRRRPLERTRETWLVGPFSIRQRPDLAGPRRRVEETWIRWTWTGDEPTAVEGGRRGEAGAVLPMSPETYQLLREASRIVALNSYDAGGQPMSDAPRTITPLACVADPSRADRWATIQLDGRDRIVAIHAATFADEVMTYDRGDRVAARTSRHRAEGSPQQECSGGWTGENPTCAGEMVDVPTLGPLVEATDRYTYDDQRRPITRARAAWTIADADADEPIGRAAHVYPRPGEWVRWTWRDDEPLTVQVSTVAGQPGTVLPPSELATRLLDEARHIRRLGLPPAP